MSTGLNIAATALDAATTEISTTAENIANAQTPGYAVERAQLSPLPGGNLLGVGDGVLVNSVAQVTDALLSANNLQAQGSLQDLTASQQVLTAIQDVFPLGQSSAAATSSSPGSSNTSIAGQLASFWSSWDAISQDPSGLAPRTQVVTQAQGLVTSLHDASAQLSQLASNTQTQLQQQLGQVNALLKQAASLNEQIVASSGGGGSANQLVDQLNNVVGQLGQLAGVSARTQQNGSAVVYIGGIAVVQGAQYTPLTLGSTSGSPPVAQVQTALPGEAPIPVPVTSGSVAGLLNGLTTQIPGYEQQLNKVAYDLATAVNNQLAKGYTAPGVTPPAGVSPPPAGSGISGSLLPMFVLPGNTPITAASLTAGNLAGSLAVNPDLVSSPSLIAAASSTANAAGAGANDASNAQAVAELASATSGSPDVAYQNLVENIGSATQAVNNEVSSQTSMANQAKQALQAATGVNQNTELTNLMQYQASYQASAKLVTVIDTAVQSLLQAV